jgi:hypothetical protein
VRHARRDVLAFAAATRAASLAIFFLSRYQHRRNTSGSTGMHPTHGNLKAVVAEPPLKAPHTPREAQLLLLAGNRLCRTLAGTGIGVGPLTTHRQATTMAQTAVAAQVHQTLDVHRILAAQIAFDL